jgi:hypothetical protein
LLGVAAWVLLSGVRRTPGTAAVRIVSTNRFRTALVIVMLPTATTLVLAWAGVWGGSNVVRALLAVPLGAVIGAIVTAGLSGDLR